MFFFTYMMLFTFASTLKFIPLLFWTLFPSINSHVHSHNISFVSIFDSCFPINLTENHISQILEYHVKFKNNKKYQLPINLLDKKKSVFLSLKSSKQVLFHTQKAWFSILKKISFYIFYNFLNQKNNVFPISKKFKTRTFP